jgi:hypothetical protein
MKSKVKIATMSIMSLGYDNLIGLFSVDDHLIGLFSVNDNLIGLFSLNDNLIGLFSVNDNLIGLFSVDGPGHNTPDPWSSSNGLPTSTYPSMLPGNSHHSQAYPSMHHSHDMVRSSPAGNSEMRHSPGVMVAQWLGNNPSSSSASSSTRHPSQQQVGVAMRGQVTCHLLSVSTHLLCTVAPEAARSGLDSQGRTLGARFSRLHILDSVLEVAHSGLSSQSRTLRTQF